MTTTRISVTTTATATLLVRTEPDAVTERRPGVVRLRFEVRRAATHLVDASAGGPLRVLGAAAGPTCVARLVQARGGLVDGDRWRVDVSVGPGASARLESVGALVLHAGVTALRVRLGAAPGARVRWSSRGVLPMPGARCRLYLGIDAAPDAAVTVAELVRVEPRADLVLRTVLRRDGAVVLDDATRFGAASGLPGRTAGASHAATMLVHCVAGPATGHAGALGGDGPRDVVVSSGEIRPGLTLCRALGTSLQQLEALMEGMWPASRQVDPA